MKRLPDHGLIKYKRDGESHAYAPPIVKAIQQASQSHVPQDFQAFLDMVKDQPPTAIRDLLTFVPAGDPVPLEEVESEADGTIDAEATVRASLPSYTDGPDQDCRSAAVRCRLLLQHQRGTITLDLQFDPMADLAPPPTVSVTPAQDLADGQEIALEGVASYYGPLDVTVRSEIERGRMVARVRCRDVGRRPARVALRLPHPQGRRAVAVDGGRYDGLAETAWVEPFDGEIELVARF